ncbi:rubredoxin [Streptomyces vinaceus]
MRAGGNDLRRDSGERPEGHGAHAVPGVRAQSRGAALTSYRCADTCMTRLWGDPETGAPPGTAFEALPDSWFCPV